MEGGCHLAATGWDHLLEHLGYESDHESLFVRWNNCCSGGHNLCYESDHQSLHPLDQLLKRRAQAVPRE